MLLFNTLKYCRNYVDPGSKSPKRLIICPGAKNGRGLRTKFLMTGGSGDDILVHKGVLKYSIFLLSYNMQKMSHIRSYCPRPNGDKSDDEI